MKITVNGREYEILIDKEYEDNICICQKGEFIRGNELKTFLTQIADRLKETETTTEIIRKIGIRELVTCNKCEFMFTRRQLDDGYNFCPNCGRRIERSDKV